MIETYTKIAAEFDVVSDNEKFNQYMGSTAAGFGLMPLSKALANAPTETAVTQPQQSVQVEGKKLEEQVKSEAAESDYSLWYWIFAIFLIGFHSILLQPPKTRRNRASGCPISKGCLVLIFEIEPVINTRLYRY